MNNTCKRCKHAEKISLEFPCMGCIHNATEKFEPMTNADHIRGMSDEELAKFLMDNQEQAKNEVFWLKKSHCLEWLRKAR